MGLRWEAPSVYLALGATDMRKQINTLAAAVQERLRLASLSGALYVFCDRRLTTLKILWWDRNVPMYCPCRCCSCNSAIRPTACACTRRNESTAAREGTMKLRCTSR